MTIPDWKRWVAAPGCYDTPVHSGTVLGVYLADDEQVEWIFCGEKVIGYEITRRDRLQSQFLSEPAVEIS